MLWRPLLAGMIALSVFVQQSAAQGARPTPPPLGSVVSRRLSVTPVSDTLPVNRGAYVHQQWTVDNGLPMNSVIALAQDAHGYIWLGTYDGLVRFDGVRFTTFNSANTPSLPMNRIVALRTTGDSSLWMMTESSQLVRLRRGVFTHFDRSRGLTGPVTAWTVDAAGRLWVGTENSVGIVDGDRIRVRHRRPGSDSVLSITASRNGVIFAGTMSGSIIRVDRAGARLMPWRRARFGTYLRGLLTSGDSLRWVVGWNHLWRYGRDTIPFVHAGGPYDLQVEPRTGALWTLGNLDVYRVSQGEQAEFITRRSDAPFTRSGFVVDDSGYVVYASGGTLLRSGRAFATIMPRDRRTAGPYIITALIQDREGSYWIGTQAAGLHRIKPATFRVYSEAEGLLDRKVSTVFEDRYGTMWIGGMRSHRLAGNRLQTMDTATGHPVEANTFLETRDGSLWVGGTLGHGLRKCEAQGLRCTRVADVRNARVLAMHEDRSGTMWIGADPDLHRNDGSGWRTVNDLPGAPKAPVRAFAETRDGALWMSTAGEGLVRHANGVFRRIGGADGLPLEHIRGLYEDKDGWLWIATEGRGLARLDPREWADPGARGSIISIGSKDGLFDDVIHGIVEDAHGRFWMGTNRGIFWASRQELLDFSARRIARIHSTSYTESDGLRNREANGGMQPASFRSRDGRLWFATQDGAAVVDPRHLSTSVPNVLVEQVVANGTGLLPDGGRVALPSAQRDVEIQYTALSFRAPGNMQFRYRLEPYDTAWVEAGTRRSAFYTKVPPGSYTFRVVASNSDGVWNEQGASLQLAVPPQFWETVPFRIVVLLALGAGVASLIRWRTRRLAETAQRLAGIVEERTSELRTQQQVLVEQAERLRQLDEVKSRFFANISHEFRTPLTLTIGPLEDLRAAVSGNADAARHTDTALRNARRLLRLVNQIMDVAKLESGEMALRVRETDLVAFVRGIAAAFASAAEWRRLTLTVDASPATLPLWFDDDALEKVIANLLSNAIKFTPPGGRIDVKIDEHEEADRRLARIRVIDTGPGIPDDHLARVFDRFYQVDESNTRAQPGTGVGLALTRELVELHGGRVTVANFHGAGTVFTVLLPCGRNHLREEQIAPDEPVREGVSAELQLATATPSAPTRSIVPVSGDDVTTILVVDDSAELRAYIREHLEPRYRVIEAGDGLAGIELATQLLPDLVISDVMMPGANGTALCRALRANTETDFIPVLLLTALADSDQRLMGLEAGADDYLAKPFEMRELRVRVDNLLRSRRRLRERFSAPPATVAAVAAVVPGAHGPTTDPSTAESTSAAPAAATAAAAASAPTPPLALDEGDRRFIERVYETVEQRLDDPEFGVTELADALAVDRSYLFRRVRELQGMAPSDLLRARRLSRAAALLTGGADTVAEIAYASGFNSVSYFCRCFRDAYGSTPSQFREKPMH